MTLTEQTFNTAERYKEIRKHFTWEQWKQFIQSIINNRICH